MSSSGSVDLRTASGRAVDAGVHGYVLVVGPDGAGKSTVVDALLGRVVADGLQVTHAHYRPGAVVRSRSDGTPVTDPHARPPRPLRTAVPKLAAVFLDHLVGGHLVWRRRRREGLLLVERGWYDMAVDPRRYRLGEGFRRVVLGLGRLLPRADVVLILGGDPERLHARKPEIAVEEVRAQLDRWRRVAPAAGRRVIEVDTVGLDRAASLAAVVRALPGAEDERGWRAVPLTHARVDLRVRGDRRAAAVYQPFSRKARAGAWVARRVLPLVPQTAAPRVGRHVEEVLHAAGLRAEGVASMRSSHPERSVLGVAQSGELHAVVKIGPVDDKGLRNESEMLGSPLRAGIPLRRPELLWCGEVGEHYVVATRAVPRRARPISTEEALRLAVLLGTASADGQPLTHGDFTPWNVTVNEDGPVLWDWESARQSREPLHDLAHFVVQQGALLRSYPPSEAVRMLCHPGGVGERYLEMHCLAGAGPDLLGRYLSTTSASDPRVMSYRSRVEDLLR